MFARLLVTDKSVEPVMPVVPVEPAQIVNTSDLILTRWLHNRLNGLNGKQPKPAKRANGLNGSTGGPAHRPNRVYRGIFPCLLFGAGLCLFFSIRNALMSCGRVSRGLITESTSMFDAA